MALLHDIGKVGVPDSVLQKRGSLNEQEWELMRQHPAIGAPILAGTETLSHLAAAVKAEHERFDGTGYPDGLRGSAIPLASRITLACDAYHAMTSDRPYRAALDPAQAVTELRSGAGTQFDPCVVDALLGEIEAEAAGERPPRRPVRPKQPASAATCWTASSRRRTPSGSPAAAPARRPPRERRKPAHSGSGPAPTRWAPKQRFRGIGIRPPFQTRIHRRV
ncbi:MAG: HD domain-containing protein [Thermoleophilaceae bacterium]|nr:HD domain-containing protein [Thermoleophilaceae bacterium]